MVDAIHNSSPFIGQHRPSAGSFAVAAQRRDANAGQPRGQSASDASTQCKGAAESPSPARLATPPGRGGLPAGLKAGIESLSGLDMSAVQVWTNSPGPARINALAYAQGDQIHLGPGQERHLAHEAWHVVQQKQGRVRSTVLTQTGLRVRRRAKISESSCA
jgi:hypothetical protein